MTATLNFQEQQVMISTGCCCVLLVCYTVDNPSITPNQHADQPFHCYIWQLQPVTTGLNPVSG